MSRAGRFAHATDPVQLERLVACVAGRCDAAPMLHVLHHADDAMLVEIDFVGTQEGAWRGLPATGRLVRYRMGAR